MPWVTPNRHKRLRKIKYYNKILHKGDVDNVKQEMKMLKVNILGISEVRWQATEKITPGTFEIFYFGGSEHKRRVVIVLDQEI